MIVVLAYCLRDQDITLELFEWIKELGGCKSHSLLLCHDARCPKGLVDQISESAKASFENVKDIAAQAEVDGWPQGANYMFKTCASIVEHRVPPPNYFFWLEPDCVPLTSDWLDKIEAEYLASGKAFMGDDVNVTVNDFQIPRHMSGVGVYQNPIHKLAGQINWANDTAWDMVARDQIIPQAHFTKLIEHAWRHPAFTDLSELNTQIRPEAVLFHASKDGSLINILREQRSQPEVMPLSVMPSVNIGTMDIFIRTYPADYPWLAYCLQSIRKYCTGFRKIWVISTTAPGLPITDFPNFEWKVQNEETTDGYLAQQIHKLYADVITDYQADNILFMDSDTLFTQPVTPATFFQGDKIMWFMTAFDKIQTPWKPIIEKFMGKPVEFEFMRRHPLVVPRWLFPKLREYCFTIHKMIISDYIRMQNYREFSEFNAMGAFAYDKFKDKFAWINTLTSRMPPLTVRQFFSWGGITDEVKTEIEQILGEAVLGPTPQIGAGEETVVDSPPSLPADPAPPILSGVEEETHAGGQEPASAPTQTEGGDATCYSQMKSGLAKSNAETTVQPVVSANGELTVGDHVRALTAYVGGIPWKRQYVIRELKKAKLVPKWKVKK